MSETGARPRHVVVALLPAALALAIGCAARPRPEFPGAPRSTLGLAAGDVTDSHAVIWARADAPALMRVVAVEEESKTPPIQGSASVMAESDLTGHVLLSGLRPATRYKTWVWFEDAEGRPGKRHALQFETAPPPDVAAPVRIAWGGDLAGQNVCRDQREGFAIFRAVQNEHPDLFIGLGNMIHADDGCEAIGRFGNRQVPGAFGKSADLESFRAHWRYTRDDDALQDLLSQTPYVAVWDDHEVVNDFGPQQDTRDEPPYRSGVPLMPLGRRAFREYNPVAPGAPFHRALRWGRHVELFVLDTRQYRDPNSQPDSAAEPKTMLGPEQRRWLEERVAASDATWKVVVSSVPISVPTGSPPEHGRDGWANFDQDTGFERELIGILKSLHAAGVQNLLWITADVHFAAAFRYVPFRDDPGFGFHEIASGPLSAGLSANKRFDRTLGTQRLFLYAPPHPSAVRSFGEAKRWLNFGVLDVGSEGQLVARVVNAYGETVSSLTLDPAPRSATCGPTCAPMRVQLVTLPAPPATHAW